MSMVQQLTTLEIDYPTILFTINKIKSTDLHVD